MSYRRLFSLELAHDFFANGGVRELLLLPATRSLKNLQQPHFLQKALPNGIQILVEVDENGNPRTALDLVWDFEVYPQSQLFQAITDRSVLTANEIWNFTNVGMSQGASGLVASTLEESGNHQGYPLVARIEINPTDSLLQSVESVSYQAVFPAKSEKWRYYFLSDPETTDLQIVDVHGQRQFPAMEAQVKQSDRLAQTLGTQFPDANLHCFESASPIVRSDQVIKNLQLHRDGQVLIKHLPNPAIGAEAVQILKVQKLISNQ